MTVSRKNLFLGSLFLLIGMQGEATAMKARLKAIEKEVQEQLKEGHLSAVHGPSPMSSLQSDTLSSQNKNTNLRHCSSLEEKTLQDFLGPVQSDTGDPLATPRSKLQRLTILLGGPVGSTEQKLRSTFEILPAASLIQGAELFVKKRDKVVTDCEEARKENREAFKIVGGVETSLVKGVKKLRDNLFQHLISHIEFFKALGSAKIGDTLGRFSNVQQVHIDAGQRKFLSLVKVVAQQYATGGEAPVPENMTFTSATTWFETLKTKDPLPLEDLITVNGEILQMTW